MINMNPGSLAILSFGFLLTASWEAVPSLTPAEKSAVEPAPAFTTTTTACYNSYSCRISQVTPPLVNQQYSQPFSSSRRALTIAHPLTFKKCNKYGKMCNLVPCSLDVQRLLFSLVFLFPIKLNIKYIKILRMQ